MYSMFDTAYNMGFADFATSPKVPNAYRRSAYNRPQYELAGKKRVAKGSEIVPYAPGGQLSNRVKPTGMDDARRLNSYMKRKGTLGESIRGGLWKNRKAIGLGAAGLGVAGAGALAYGAYKNSKKRKRNRFGF